MWFMLSDRFEGWIVIENPEKTSKHVDIIVLDKKRQNILLKGRYKNRGITSENTHKEH